MNHRMAYTLMIAAVLVAAVVLLMATAPFSASKPDHDTLVLLGGKVYPSPESPAIENGVVIVHGGKISAVGERRHVTVPQDADVLDCAGKIVAAGFQNSHVHFSEAKWNNAGTQPAARLSTQLTSMFAVYGFTTVVDTGSDFENTSRLRTRIESGEVAGPRVILPVTSLFPPNGLPYYLEGLKEASPSWEPAEPETPDAAIKFVQRNPGQKQDIVKLFTGSILANGVKPMPLEVARAAVTEAHREGRLVFAHPSNVEGVQIAMDAGVDVLAHTTSSSETWTPELVSNVTKHNLSLIPTLKLWKYVLEGAPDRSIGERMLQGGVEQLKAFSRAGGQVLFGTDVGFMYDYNPLDEFVYMGRAGLTPMQVLASLTTAPASRFKEDARRGRVAVGMDADLVVLGSDPAKDLRNFTDVRYTIRHGRVIYPASPLRPMASLRR